VSGFLVNGAPGRWAAGAGIGRMTFGAHTKAELLRFSLAFALSKVRFKRFRLGLTEDERDQIADDTIWHLRKYGAWKELDDVVEAPIAVAGSQRTNRDDGGE
jgi:hypothetical protein